MTKQKKIMFMTIAVVFILLVLFAVISAVTAGFTKWKPDPKAINPDNLYSTADISLVDMKDGNGITLDIDEDTGAIVVNGRSTASEDLVYNIGTVELYKGEYTLTACKNASSAP